MGAEYLNQGDLECRDLAVQENASQIQLYLETNVHIGTVYSGRPPEREPTVGDLVQPRTLSVGKLLELHRFLCEKKNVSKNLTCKKPKQHDNS